MITTKQPPGTGTSYTIVEVIVIILLTILVISILIFLGKCLYRFCKSLSSDNGSDYQEIENNSDKRETDFGKVNGYGGVRRNRETDAPSGLLNTSETCYMNSMIQAIASTEVLIREYDELLQLGKSDRNYLLKHFVDLLKNINNPRDRLTCVADNTNRLKILMKSSNWTQRSQQDSFHLLSVVIKAIQEDLNDILEQEGKLLPPKINILHAFSVDCGSNKVQQHLALALPLCGNFRNPPGVELHELMDAFFVSSIIEDSPDVTQMYMFERVPSVFIIHIQANEWDAERGVYIKPKYHIRFSEIMSYRFQVPTKLDLSEMKTLDVEFQLRAVVHHMGTVSGGHYVTYRMHKGSWYLTSDSQVERTNFNKNIVPYILVYEKMSEREVVVD